MATPGGFLQQPHPQPMAPEQEPVCSPRCALPPPRRQRCWCDPEGLPCPLVQQDQEKRP